MENNNSTTSNEILRLKSINFDLIMENNALKKKILELENKNNDNNNDNKNDINIINANLSDDEIKFMEDPVSIKLEYSNEYFYFYKSTGVSNQQIQQEPRKIYDPNNEYLLKRKRNTKGRLNVFSLSYVYEQDILKNKTISLQLLQKLLIAYPTIKKYIVVPLYHLKNFYYGKRNKDKILVSINEFFNDFPQAIKHTKYLYPVYKYNDYQVYYFINITHKEFENIVGNYWNNKYGGDYNMRVQSYLSDPRELTK